MSRSLLELGQPAHLFFVFAFHLINIQAEVGVQRHTVRLQQRCQGWWDIFLQQVQKTEILQLHSCPGLAGTELISFIAAHAVPRFRFRKKTMLIAHRCFSYCRAVLTSSQGLFSFSHRPAGKELGVQQLLGRDINRTADLTGQRAISHDKTQQR